MDVVLDYMNAFRRTYIDRARLLPEQSRGRLAHLPYLGSKYHAITYFSPGVGGGYRFVAGSGPDESIVQSAPLHRFVFPFLGVNVLNYSSAATISNVGSATVIGIHFKGSVELTDARVVFAACEWLDFAPLILNHSADRAVIIDSVVRVGMRQHTEHLAYFSGGSHPMDWSIAAAERDATHYILTALAELQMESLQPRIDQFVDKVLMLGDFSADGRQRLALLKEALNRLGYETFTVEDVPDLPNARLDDKVLALIIMSKFVVMDDSSPSGQLAEVPLLNVRRPVIIMRLAGTYSSAMVRGAGGVGTLISEYEYTLESANDVLAGATVAAEELGQDMARHVEVWETWRASAPSTSHSTLGLQPWLSQ